MMANFRLFFAAHHLFNEKHLPLLPSRPPFLFIPDYFLFFLFPLSFFLAGLLPFKSWLMSRGTLMY